MLQTDFPELALELDIVEELVQGCTCMVDELFDRLPFYSWKEMFCAVDRLNRKGTVALKHPVPFRGVLSFAPS